MYNLKYVEDNKMILEVEGHVVAFGEGKEVVRIAVKEYGLVMKDVLLAFQVLIDNPDHNNAHFGIMGGFIFTNKVA